MVHDGSEQVTVLVRSEEREPQQEVPADVGPLEVFRRIYQFFYSKVVGLILILAVTVLVLLGVVIGQAPAGTYDNAESKAQFLEQATQKYGGWANVMDFLGLFRIFSSPVFLAVITLLALSIIACTVHRIPQLWQRYRHPRTHVSDRFFDRSRYRATIIVPDASGNVLETVTQYLQGKRYRVIADERDPQHSVYADKNGWGPFGTVIAHASFIVIIVAFLVSSMTGIDKTITVPIDGDRAAVGSGTSLSVEATSFKATYDKNNRPLDYVSHLVVYDDGKKVNEQDVRVNQPLRYDGVKFHQATFGVAADVLVKDSGGKTVFKESVPLQWTSNDGTNSLGKFQIPSKGLEIIVVTPASGQTESELLAGQAGFEVYKIGSDELVDQVTAEQGKAVTSNELSLTFERERKYTGIMVRHDLGALWMWIGSALLVIGMTMTFACRHRRIWIRADGTHESRIRFASADKEDMAFERQFEELAHGVAGVFERDKGL